jgi:hypothetical protein
VTVKVYNMTRYNTGDLEEIVAKAYSLRDVLMNKPRTLDQIHFREHTDEDFVYIRTASSLGSTRQLLYAKAKGYDKTHRIFLLAPESLHVSVVDMLASQATSNVLHTRADVIASVMMAVLKAEAVPHNMNTIGVMEQSSAAMTLRYSLTGKPMTPRAALDYDRTVEVNTQWRRLQRLARRAKEELNRLHRSVEQTNARYVKMKAEPISEEWLREFEQHFDDIQNTLTKATFAKETLR